MDRVIKLFLTASLLSCSCRCSKVRVPKSVTAIKGTCVVVPCSTTSHTYATWYKYQRSGYPPVYSKDTKDIINQFRGRTSLLGNAMQGNCSLKIDNVRQEDGGISVYVWINPHSIYGDYTEIKVLAPSETRISVESTQVEGTLFSAKCTVRHSCPVSPPLLEWLGLSSVSNEVTTTQDSGGLWVSVAHAQFNASRRDHGKRVTCRRMSDGNTATGDALNILYAPTNVNIHTSGTTPVVEGSNISLTCSSDSNPPVASYEWRIIQMNSTIKHKTRSLLIQDVRRDMKISCIADNSIGLGESDQLSLNVHYAPTNVNIHTSGRTPVVEGSNISLTCSSDSNPPVASYEWRIIQMNSTIKHKTRSLLLQDVRRDMKISCIAHNSIGLGESDQLSLNVHYAPTNVNIHTSGTTPVVEGSNISLTCSSDSNPPVASYEWRIIQMNSTIKHKTRSLLLQEVRRDMKISCIAHNSIGLGESDQLSLNVHYAPTNVNIHTSGTTPVVEGGNISLTCSSDSNPPVASYEWRIIQMNSTIKHKTRSLLLQDVRRDMKISCIAHNSIGLGESDQLSLNVHYAPTNVNIHTSGTTPVVEGGNISLTCSSDSNPPVASYEWRIIQMNSTIKHKTRSLLLQDVRRDMKISCIAHNSIGLGESDQLSLNVHFPPTILPDSACWEREGSLHCMCWVEAEPNASISWTVDGRSALLPHFNMTNNYMGRTTVSVMTGPPGHFVTCEAANYLGNDTYQMSGFPQLAQGTVGFYYFILVAIVLIVVGIVLVVHRRLKKRHEHLRGPKKATSSEYTTQASGTQTKAQEMTSIDDIYANDVLGGHTWRTTMVTSQTPEDEMANIYLNE
ncbi:B-cell receptor CD22-like isoform X2 [Electrophorus electricus]|nr:B-cell receptor CD22-like isoform X2 [Electrophorus electricus]XP_035382008.1 B-cell receptor CD22-like isoform X2 [Electrophorus electricus]